MPGSARVDRACLTGSIDTRFVRATSTEARDLGSSA